MKNSPLSNYLSLIKFSHTIFALPFALIGFFLGVEFSTYSFDWTLLVKVILCMVFARSAAMAFNRYIDRDIDEANERTSSVREIPNGTIRPKSALLFVLANCVFFIVTTFFINTICFYLSPVALAVVLGYSFTKRFTALCHLILGVGLSLAPIGAYLAVTGTFAWLPLYFSFAVLFWVAGFDMIYSLQDADFDRKMSLHSIPAKIGNKATLTLSIIFHLITTAYLIYAAFHAEANLFFWIGVFVFIALLLYQHLLVKPNDLSKVNIAFFTTNGIASVIFSIFVILSFTSKYMFNTELIHQLQQLDHPILYWFMVLISALGTIPAVLALVSAITFAVDFKKGLVLVNIVAWTAILTFVGKQQFNYPRPVDIDNTVNTIYYDKTELDLIDSQPQEFLESFSPELLDQTRNDKWDRYGFPSGHTSVQVCLWITLFFLFRKRWIAIAGASFIALTIFSRLYLAHHFLGDVIGGFVIGLITSLLLIFLVHKTAYLRKASHQFKSLSILWLPALFIPFAVFIPLWLVGCLIGLNAAAIIIIQVQNFPVFHVILWKRILAAFICIVLLLTAFYINKSLIILDSKFLELIVISAFYFIVIKGSIMLCNRLHLIRFRF